MRGVAKVYRTAEGDVESLKPLDFDIREGEFLSVVGPERLRQEHAAEDDRRACCRRRAASIEIAGQRVDGPAAGIGIVFQSHVLLAWRTVLDNILLQIEVRKLPRAARRCEHARELIDDGRPRRLREQVSRGSSPAACSSARRSAARWCTTRRSC